MGTRTYPARLALQQRCDCLGTLELGDAHEDARRKRFQLCCGRAAALALSGSKRLIACVAAIILVMQANFYADNHAFAVSAVMKARRAPSITRPAGIEYHLLRRAWARGTLRFRPSGSATASRRGSGAAHHAQLRRWAESCLENFENRAALVRAEITRIEGRNVDAMCLYEKAIRSTENEALANEFVARFYATRGFETNSHAHLRNARYCYVRWALMAKCGNPMASIRS